MVQTPSECTKCLWDLSRFQNHGLLKGYREFIDDISRVLPVVRVDYDQFATAEEMAEVIHREYLTHSFLREATRFDPTR